MNKILHYFGTNLTSPGHYFWKLDNDHSFGRSDLNFNDFPFNPEDLFKDRESRIRQTRNKGDVDFFHVGGWSICRIEGSCIDTRWGTKTVFFVNEVLADAELVSRIIGNPLAAKIVNAFPFDFKWPDAVKATPSQL